MQRSSTEWRYDLHYLADTASDLLQNESILSNLSAINSSITTSHKNESVTASTQVHSSIIIFTTSFLIVFCAVSLTVNLVVLTSLCFVRIKINATLYISLSLAAADTFSLFLFALGLLLFSLLPRGFGININAPCASLVIEALRMGAILTTMLHLVFLAGNHYLGILKPLRYPRYMTKRNVKCMALILWSLPPALLLIIIFTIAHTDKNPCSPEFLVKSSFRTAFAIPFFTALALMLFIYCHIYRLVKKHHRKPLRGKHDPSIRHRNCSSNDNFTRSPVNKKVVKTTLMILGSVIGGWLPAFTYFVLCCKDCPLNNYWQLNTLFEHFFLVAINFLMIAKTATNSYIYACRMKELKLSLQNLKNRVLTSVR